MTEATKKTTSLTTKMALAAALAGTALMSGCASMTPDFNKSVSNQGDVEKAVKYYRETGVNPINYDACGQLDRLTRQRPGGLVGGMAGAGVGKMIGGNVGMVLGGVGGYVADTYLGKNDADKLNRDCQVQQAINREAGGSVRGRSVTFQPGGIYR